MKIVFLIWIILFVTILVQIYFIIRYIQKDVHIPYNNDYSKETLEKTKTVIAAIENNEIKNILLPIMLLNTIVQKLKYNIKIFYYLN